MTTPPQVEKRVRIDDTPRMGEDIEEQSDSYSLTDANGNDPTIVAGERLYEHGLTLMKQRIQIHQEKLCKQEMSEADGITFCPEILKKQTYDKDHMDAFVKRMYDWKKHTKQKHDAKAKKIIAEDMEEVTFKPTVDKISTQLIEIKAKSKSYVGPVKGWKKHFSSYMDRRNVPDFEFELTHKFHPSINPSSQVLCYDTPVSERLWKDSYNRKQQIELLQTWDSVRQGYDVMTGKQLFQPTTNEASRSRSKTPNSYCCLEDNDVVTLLLERGEEYKKKREMKMSKVNESLSFQPRTNPKSKEILLRNELERQQKLKEESSNHGPPFTSHDSKDSRKRALSQENEANSRKQIKTGNLKCYTKSTVRTRSAERRFDVSDFYERVNYHQSNRSFRLDSLRENLDKENESQCTFTPMVSEYSMRIFAQRHGYNHDEKKYRNQNLFSKPAVSSSRPQHHQKQRESCREDVAPPCYAQSVQQQQGTTPLNRGPLMTGTNLESSSHRGRNQNSSPYQESLNVTPPSQDMSAAPSSGAKSEFLQSLEADLKNTVDEWVNGS